MATSIVATETTVVVGGAKLERRYGADGASAVDWKPSPQREVAEKNLWYWNLSMAILHGVQAVVVLALSLTAGNFKKFLIPMTTTFTSWERGFPQAAIQQRANMPFVGVTSGFAFMSSAAHIIVLLCFQRYLDDLRRGRNLFRWYEYAASSSLMIALIAQLFGVYDVITLVVIMSVNACMNLFGLLHETMNEGRAPKDVDWTSFWFGCFAGLVPWAVIFANLAGQDNISQIPGFVWALLFVYLVFFQTFPINMILQYKQWHWFNDSFAGWPGSGYLFGERMYQVQSLVSKSLLLWLVVGGANQPNAFTGTRVPNS
jgi:hypothetical protein